ncbi:lipopolysaccharide biosynthesis protein [Thiopseudomonas alkaliphila]|uniref:lipopolysaccharide biosynthesis protein n=1 Tax=Thiopseudomonas alkaliphila TaxID=1697053 RepID=UPI002574D8DE|nr:oligosaccharide flippase family protein [Thiopseudomonas alkaliphila]MDM1707276.1 oligosaccharide flippase family protein [Thiopseudomonas alkaliphila]
MRKIFYRLVPEGFARHVGMLVGGTTFAQVVMLLALPILTRLYSPDDFGVLAVYASCLAILSSVICLRLEIAIPIPKNDIQALNLVVLALLSAVILTLFVSLCLLPLAADIAALLGKPELAAYIWLLPVGLLSSAGFAVIQYWASRKKKFSLIARARIQQAIAGVSTQLLFGCFTVGPLGLIVGQIVVLAGGTVLLTRMALEEIRPLWGNISYASLWRTLVEYQRFPRFSTLEAFCNSGGMQLPVILIATYVASPEIGFLMLAMKIMAAPMTLLGGAVGQVYLSQASERYRDGELPQFTAEVLKNLCLIGAPLILAGGLLAPKVFPIIFGPEWLRAGELVLWMVPWFVLQFMAAPISMGLHVTGNQKTALGLQLMGLAIRFLFLLVAVGLGAENYIIEFYILSGAVFYAIYLFIVLGVVKVPLNTIVNALAPGFIGCAVIIGLYLSAISVVN